MIEIRWHARAGQGAKSIAQVFALAGLHAGRAVQAFPEYGPERSGAPMRAYTRIDHRPIRRRYSVTEPDAAVVLERSLIGEPFVREGLAPEALLIVDSPFEDAVLAAELERPVLAIDASAIAAEHGLTFVNVVMAGALAAALGEPALEDIEYAIRKQFGKRPDVETLVLAATSGHDAITRETACG